MIEILVKVIIVAVAVIVFAVSFREEWRRLRAREREYDAFERRRVIRQRACDRHAKAVARRELIDEWVQIHFAGEARHDRY